MKVEDSKISSFGARLREAFSNIPNKEIAEMMGISNPSVSAYMSGNFPATDKLIEISRMTGINIHWLLTGDGEKKVKEPDLVHTTLLFHGYKYSVGTTIVAIHVAFILANKGYKVLIVGHKSSSERGMFLSFEEAFSPKDISADKDSYIDTEIPNLSIFIKKGLEYPENLKDRIKPFNKINTLVKEKYDFIICDAPSQKNPFRNSEMPFSEFLSKAKVLVPYELKQSTIDDVKKITEFIDAEKTLGYQAELLGLFISREDTARKRKGDYKEPSREIANFVRNKMLKTAVRVESNWAKFNFTYPINKELKQSKLFIDCTALTDEILQRINTKS